MAVARFALMMAAFAGSQPFRASGDTILVAAASNVSHVMQAIMESFESTRAHEVKLSLGSTGKLYAQIRNGAPFDLFFAADEERPRLLESEGIAVPGTRFTYASGRLVLWSRNQNAMTTMFRDPEGNVLPPDSFRFLAIANPKLAPYGAAAREVLRAMGAWDRLQKKIVRGENVTQAYQFVMSGSADLGFAAEAQIRQPGKESPGSCWLVPGEMSSPILQQAVLLNDSPGAREFLDFTRGAGGRRIFQKFSYGIPPVNHADDE